MELVLIGLAVALWGIAFFTGYHWRRSMVEAKQLGHILCTPEQVVEAVLREYQDYFTVGGIPVLADDEDGERMSAERIAANLIQITERGKE